MQTKEAKRTAAELRQTEAAKRTPQQRLARLDEMFGPGLGGAKERAKLAKKLAAKPVLIAPGEALFAEPAEPGQSGRKKGAR